MPNRTLAAALVVAASVLSASGRPAAAENPATAPPANGIRVTRLIRDLGSPSYSQRQEADEELAKLGATSRAQLEAGARSTDPEVRLRCQRLLKHLDIEDMWLGSQITLVAKETRVSDAVRQLAEQSGNDLSAGDQYGSFEEAKLKLQLRNVPYWQAVDALCRQSGNRARLRYGAENPGWVLVSGDAGHYPVAYAGPIRAQITDARRVFVEEFNYKNLESETTHTFQWNVMMTWEDGFRLVAHDSQLKVVQAVADVPTKIFAEGPTDGGWQVVEASSQQFSTALRIHPPPQAARQLDRLDLEWEVIAVGGMANLEIPTDATGTEHSQDDVVAVVDDLTRTSANRWEVTVSISRDLVVPEPEEILYLENEFEMLDAQGKPFAQHGARRLGIARGTTKQKLTFLAPADDSTPAKLVLRYPRIRDRRTLSIPFRNVPLPIAQPD